MQRVPLSSHPRFKDLTGKKFGRITPLYPVDDGVKRAKAVTFWLCQCDCGVKKVIRSQKVISGNTRSCGCFMMDALRDNKRRVTHGMRRTPEYYAYHNMIKRCFIQSDPNYHRYGGRGIIVCQEWRDSFEAFVASVGMRPSPKHSLERLDNGGNYEPKNCCWATKIDQCRNRRNNLIVVAFGKEAPLAAFFEQGSYDPAYRRCRWRLEAGWSIERAIGQMPRVHSG